MLKIDVVNSAHCVVYICKLYSSVVFILFVLKSGFDVKMGKPIKIVLLGDDKTGKTSLILLRICGTIDKDLLTAPPDVHENNKTCIIWDSSAEMIEDFSGEVYKGAKIFIACFAVDRKASLNNLREHLTELRKQPEHEHTPIILVCTKKDLRLDKNYQKKLFKERGETMFEEGLCLDDDKLEEFKDLGVVNYMETTVIHGSDLEPCGNEVFVEAMRYVGNNKVKKNKKENESFSPAGKEKAIQGEEEIAVREEKATILKSVQGKEKEKKCLLM